MAFLAYSVIMVTDHAEISKKNTINLRSTGEKATINEICSAASELAIGPIDL